MWFTLILVVILAIILSKFISASAVWRYKTKSEKITHLLKFALAYSVFLISFGRRLRRKWKRRSAVNFAEKMTPLDEDWTKDGPRRVTKENETDAIQFIGSDKAGNSCFVSLAHRQHGIEVILVVRYAGQIYTLPEHPSVIVREEHKNEKRVFIGKGLRFELREPCRKWRVWINTTVRKGIATSANRDESDLVHLKLNGWWAANTDVFDFDTDLDPSLISKTLARSSWTKETFELLGSKPDIAHQWGQLIGQLRIVRGEETMVAEEISMHCLKSRISAGTSANALSKLDVHTAAFEDATYLVLGSVGISGSLTSFGFGYVAWPDGRFTSITDTSLIYEEPNFQSDLTFATFSTNNRHFYLRVHTDSSIPLSINSDREPSHLRLSRLNLNGKRGYGFHLLSQSKCRPSNLPIEPPTGDGYCPTGYAYTTSEASLPVLPLSHRAAGSSDLTGGKGCNLAYLSQLQGHFTVPTGLCVTTAAYKAQIDEYVELKSLVVKLENYGRLTPEELESTCTEIERLLATIEISKSLRSAIEHELNRTFADDDGWAERKFAVRSSAVGEDSSDLSTAGQLETYLDRTGLENICEALRLCWASQFRLPAVQYRKQHGQPLTHPVAVVVQEMVQPDVSGVLFTVDPVNGDPSKMVINANPGIGELVVSGAVTPDTITLDRGYFDDTVVWNSVILGNDENAECSLAKSLAIKLGEIGILIERASGGKPKDIEWAVRDGEIYILQARDITSLETETEYDLIHEFDDAIRNEDDCYSTANVGEVMSEPATPLSISTQTMALELAGNVMQVERGLMEMNPFVKSMMHTTCNRTLFNIFDTFYRELGYMEDTRVPEICFMGHPLNMPEVKKAAVERFGVPTAYQQITRTLAVIKNTFFVIPSFQEEKTKRFGEFKLDVSTEFDQEAVYGKINDSLKELAHTWNYHTLNSMASSFGYNFVAAVLLPRDPKEELTADHFSDIATLFSSCQNVVSADVPAALKDLAQTVFKAGKAEEFREMGPDDALQWLMMGSDSGTAGSKFRDFLEKHGHRSIGEIDMGATSWRSEPKPLVVTVQNMLRDEKTLFATKEELPVDEAISKLKTNIGFVQKQLLRFFVPMARTGVVRREHSKNIAIKVTDVIRQAYRRLGTLLTNRGYLPDRELIFYLSHTEIGDLICDRPAKLVAKAVRRRKLMPLLKTFHFPEIIIGHPKPLDQSIQRPPSDSSVVIKGTPVSHGVAEGPVRVAKRLTDAKDTQPGEILIATSTDIGWSPYFPMLAGVVTELGGLLSHGAVVAREYGLPCIVNAQNATNLFQTGDMARLDASRGILEKL